MRIIKKTVELADNIEFSVPSDCSAVRVLSNVSATVTASQDGQQTDAPAAASDVTIETTCFGRDISISTTSAAWIVVLLQVD